MSEINGNPASPSNDVRKLLGGYSTGTLSDAERKLLFEAALEDESLFAELMREEELRECLEMPGAKARLLAALEEKPATWRGRLGGWIARPGTLALAGGLAGAVLVFVVWQEYQFKARPREVAANLALPREPQQELKDQGPSRA